MKFSPFCLREVSYIYSKAGLLELWYKEQQDYPTPINIFGIVHNISYVYSGFHYR
jgi:hypothetical protein